MPLIQFYFLPPGSMSHSQSSEKISSSKSSKQTITRKVTNILVGESGKRSPESESGGSVPLCLQLTYHRACRNHLILMYPREILVLDLDINQTVGIIPMERTGSPFSVVSVFLPSLC